MRNCETCKFAVTSIKLRTIRTPVGMVHQSGGKVYFCNRPGGTAGELNINLDKGSFDCGSWEPKEGGNNDVRDDPERIL